MAATRKDPQRPELTKNLAPGRRLGHPPASGLKADRLGAELIDGVLAIGLLPIVVLRALLVKNASGAFCTTTFVSTTGTVRKPDERRVLHKDFGLDDGALLLNHASAPFCTRDSTLPPKLPKPRGQRVPMIPASSGLAS